MTWTKEDKLLASDMFFKEVPVRKIADYFGVTRYRVLTDVSQLAVSGEYRSIDTETIISRYDDGLELEDISTELKVPTVLVRRVLVTSGKRPRVDDGEYIDSFREINDEDSAYWLGFMFSDGYIKSDFTGFGLDLDKIDKGHILKFRDFLGIDKTLGEYGDMVRLIVTDSNAAADLIAKGCLPKKSHVLGPPEGVPSELERHFIRGVVDGDGSIGWHSKGQPRIRVCGTYELLEWISAVGPTQASLPTPMKSIYEFRVNGRNKAMDWIHWLYKDASVYLSRKYDMYLELSDFFE